MPEDIPQAQPPTGYNPVLHAVVNHFASQTTKCPTRRAEHFAIGGAKGIRTPDLLIANETRYQLRHSPKLLMNIITHWAKIFTRRSAILRHSAHRCRATGRRHRHRIRGRRSPANTRDPRRAPEERRLTVQTVARYPAARRRRNTSSRLDMPGSVSPMMPIDANALEAAEAAGRAVVGRVIGVTAAA